MINLIMPLYYRIGEFVASTQIVGIHHPDMQIDNIGIDKEGHLKFIDYADIRFVDYPIDIDQMQTALMPIIRSLGKNELSQFRLGYISRGGWIADIIFSNLSKNKGLDSSICIDNCDLTITRPYVSLNTENLKFATEWKSNNFDGLFENYMTIDEYSKYMSRHLQNIRVKYYSTIYYLHVYYHLFEKMRIQFNQAIILINLTRNELILENSLISYGYYLKADELIKSGKCTMDNHEVELINMLDILKNNIMEFDRVQTKKHLVEELCKEIQDLELLNWVLNDVQYSI